MRSGTKCVVKQVGTKVVQKTRVGKWQVTVFQVTKVKTPADVSQRDYIPEQTFVQLRTCLQHSTFNRLTGEWRNQQIWLNRCHELNDLRDILHQLEASAEEALFSVR